MKGKLSLKLVNEFDGMYEDSIEGIGDNTSYSVSVRNLDGDYQ